MAKSCESAVLYTAVYDDVDAALADLAALEQLHKAEMIGKYDAAVVDSKDGEPHIVKRVDRPAVRVSGWDRARSPAVSCTMQRGRSTPAKRRCS